MLLRSLVLATGILISNLTFSQIVINPGGGAAAVTANLIGPGLTVSGTPTINCDPGAYGSFSNGLTTNLGVSNGLIMTSGQASLAAGPNNATSDGWCVGTSFSDPQLTSLDPQANEDVCIITISVIPQCSQLTIRFVFGSEEYPEFVSSGFNDAFGFFVSGPNPLGGNYNNFNLATIPGGGQASIDNVNPTTNAAYYVNNTGGTTIEYDGFTTVLTPTINVTPCQVYTFKLAIADAGDCAYDSGVFIDLLSCTNAFTLTTSSTPDNCGANTGTATANVVGGIGPFSYNWSPAPGGGQGTANATGLTGGVTYTVNVTDLGLPCGTPQSSSQTIGNTGTAPTITVTPTTATVCNGTGTVLTAGGGLSYTWSPATGLSATTGAVVTATPSVTTTYTVTGTAACGSGTASTTITVNPIPSTTAGSNSPICAGSALNLTATASGVPGSTYSWTGPNGFTSAVQNPTIPAATTAASGTYTVTVLANGCSSTSTVNVTVNPLPTTTAGSNSPICAGATLNLTATPSAGASFAWTGPNGFTSAIQNPTIPAATTAASGTYTVTVSIGACSSTSTVNVTVNPQPVANAGPDAAICVGGSTVLAGTGGGTYSWTPAATLNNATIAGPTANPAITTTYTLTVSMGTCTSTDQVTVSVSNGFDATITPAGPFCANAAAVNLTAVDGGGTWTGTGITNGANGTFDPSVAGAGTHTITYTIPGACGDVQTTNIVVNAIPTTTAGSNSPICEGSTLNLTATLTAGATYSWTGPNGFTSAVQNPTLPAATTAASGTYTVTITNNGCTSTSTVNVTVNALPTTTAGSNAPICEGSTLNLTATGGGTATFAWTGPNGFTSALQNPSIPAVTLAATGAYTVTITDNGCTGTSIVNVTIDPVADATITPAGPFCTTDAAVILTAATPGGTWSGTGITNPATGAFDPAVAGNNTVTITYTIAGACGDVQTTNIVVSDQLDATINPAGPFCASNPSVVLVAADAGGTWSGTGITNAATGTFNPAIAGAGTHTITYTLTGSCGDVQTTTIQVFADADATINPAGPFCLTDPAVPMTSLQTGGTWSGIGITNPATGTFDPATAGVGTTAITYTINGVCGDAQTINVQVIDTADTQINAVGPFCVNSPAVTLTAAMTGGTWSGTGITNAATGAFNPAIAGPGSHVITYTIAGNCGNSSNTTIVVNALPVVTFTVDNPNGCTPVAATLTNTTAGTNTAIWSINGNQVSTDPASYIGIYTIPGCYDVTLTVNDASGCSNTATVNSMICVSGIPVADFDFSPTNATILNPTINFVNESSGATNYTWNFDGLGTSTQTNPSFTFPGTGPGNYNVCLTATNVDGCLDSICKIVTIYDEFIVYVPNAFTNDNDGVNDMFMPIVSGHDPLSYEFYIFNRWGELVFESHNAQVGWDGKYKAQDAKQDVYVWKLKVKKLNNAEDVVLYGHVSLLK